MTNIATDKNVLPGPIEATLRRLIWRARTAIALRGVLLTLAAALLGVLAAMGIAAAWLPDEPWQHYALTFLWLAAGAAAAVAGLIRPLARSFSLAGIARVIEQRHPELQERISSTVELLGSTDSPEIRGSDALIGALAAEAVGDVRTVRPRREITFRKARTPLYFLCAAGAIMAILLAFYPRPTSRLLAKTLAPYLNLPNIYAGDLRITPGDCVLAEGMRLEVTVSVVRADSPLRGKVRSAELRIERTGGTKKVFPMTALPDGSFACATEPLSRSGPFRYRIRAGDAVSRYYSVRIVPRPAARSIEVGYEYPPYMHRPNTPPGPGPGSISGPAGAVATVRVHLNKPAAEAELTINGATAEITQTDPAAYTFRHNLTADADGVWRLVLTDEHGFKSDPIEHDITVSPDAPPSVHILKPGQEKLKLRPTDRLPVFYRLTDDFGVSRAEMLVSIDGRAQKADALTIAAAQTQPNRARLAGATTLDLAAMDIAGARRITFKVRAWDNLPASLGGPQEGTSEARTIELDVKAPAYAFQVQLALDLRLRKTLEGIYKELKAAKKISEPLRRSMPSARKLTQEAAGKIDRMRGHLFSAEQDARTLAQVAAGSPYPKMSEKLTALADKHIGKARELAGLVKITDAAKQRADLADEADFQIDRAIAIVSDMLKELDVLTELARRAMALEELARREAELAAAAPAAATTQPVQEGLSQLSERQWQQAQREVAGDVADIVRQTPAALAEALKVPTARTADLAEMARRLQRSQQALIQSTAADQRIAEMKKQLRQLAAEQAKLARQAARMTKQADQVKTATAPAADAARRAAEAAKALTTTRPASAIPAQAAAAKALETVAQRAATKQLAAAAEEMAARQEQLAKRSEIAREYQQQARAASEATSQAASQTTQSATTQQAQAATQAAAAVQARADRYVQDLAQAQRKLAEQIPQLKRLAQQATRQARAAMSRHDPAGKMQQAAGELQRSRPTEAARPQAAAAEQLRQIAKAARSGPAPTSPAHAPRQVPGTPKRAAEQVGKVAQEARGLAQRQKQLQRRTAELTRQLPAAQAQQHRRELTRLRAEQQQIARAAGKLSDDVKAQAPQPDRIDTRAARAAAEASRRLASKDLAGAAKAADKAAGEMAELAGRLERAQAAEPQRPEPATEAERQGQLAGRAGELSRQQKQVAKEISALAAKQRPQLLAGRQTRITKGTGEVQKGAELISEHVAELLPTPEAGKLAQAATKSLRQAAAAQRAAGRAMSAGRTGQSIRPQQTSAQALGKAAQALKQLGRHLAEQAKQTPPPPPGKGQDEETPGQLAEAYDAARAAAQDRSAAEAAKAARLLAALARRAMQQAKAMGVIPGQAAMPGQAISRGATLDSNARVGSAAADLKAGELGELGISPDDWARLSGELRDQILQAARMGGPEEYRTLIKRYFQALARKAAEKDSNRGSENK